MILRHDIYNRAENWKPCIDIAEALVKLVPLDSQGWILRSFAFHSLKQTRAAFDLLLPAWGKFPTVWTIPYDLACYCAQHGQLEDAKTWFHHAMAINQKVVQSANIDYPDLISLWDSLRGSLWRRA